MKKYNRTLLVALLIVAVFATAIGGTFAWFTDSVTSGENVIQSGNLDLEVDVYDSENDSWIAVEKDTKIFNEEALYEPGYTETVFLRVKNAGNLALKYKAALSIYDSVIGKSVQGNEIKLSEYLQAGFYCIDYYDANGHEYWPTLKPFLFGSREQTLSLVSLVDLKDMNEDGILDLVADRPLLAGEATDQILVLVLHMPTTVGNEANHVTGTAAPQIKIGLNVVATQYMHEEDSFDNQYDADATYPDMEGLNDYPKAEIVVDDSHPEVELYDLFNMGTKGEILNLDIAYNFKATETPEEAAAGPYGNWHADYVITVDNTVKRGSAGLGGAYGEWGSLGFLVPEDAVPGTEYRLLQAVSGEGIQFSYESICSLVGEFMCGAFNLSEDNIGTKMTVELRLYELDGETLENENREGETGHYIVVDRQVYAFEAPNPDNVDKMKDYTF